MIHIVQKMRDLRISEIYNVYSASLEQSAAEHYGKLDINEGKIQAQQDFYQYLRDVFFTTKGACIFVYEYEGGYLSALRMEPYRDGLLLAGLETAPDSRNRGIGTDLVKFATDYAREKNIAKVYSHVEKANTASMRLHTKCGFSKISESTTYIDGTFSNRASTFCLDFTQI